MIHFRRIPARDPRLRRLVWHDDESRRYPFPTAGLTLTSTKHVRRIAVLDQLRLGSCTGNAGIGCLGTDPLWSTLTAAQQAASDERAAVSLYSMATLLDDVRGQYPPTDTGSSGLGVAKALTADGRISGYTHTFNLQDALLALTVTPVIVGMAWYQGMMDTDPDGRVHPTGSVQGGHEIVADEVDVENGQVWFTNSWGTSWGVTRDGVAGRFYLTFADLGTLLGQQGDVTVFVPRTAPAPIPIPVPPIPPIPVPPVSADLTLAAVLRQESQWFGLLHGGPAGRIQAALTQWLKTAPKVSTGDD